MTTIISIVEANWCRRSLLIFSGTQQQQHYNVFQHKYLSISINRCLVTLEWMVYRKTITKRRGNRIVVQQILQAMRLQNDFLFRSFHYLRLEWKQPKFIIITMTKMIEQILCSAQIVWNSPSGCHWDTPKNKFP